MLTNMAYEKYLERLELFNEKAEIIKNCKFTKFISRQRAGVTVSKTNGKPVKIKMIEPDIDSLHALILNLRFFIQERDKSDIENISKAYKVLPISKREKDSFIKAKNKLDNFLDSKINFKFNGENPTYKYVFDNFIYGSIAHANIDKKKIVDYWKSEELIYPFLKTSFIAITIKYIEFIEYIQKLNINIIKQFK